MAEPKKEPKRKAVHALVSEELWRKFRSSVLWTGLSVTEAIEQAISEWLETKH